MDNLPTIFHRAYKMLNGVIYNQIHQYPTFLHLESQFTDAWYNYLVPTTKPQDFNWPMATDLINSEKSRGWTVSYYIYDSLLPLYESYLSKIGISNQGSELYMVRKTNQFLGIYSGKFEELTIDNLPQFIEMDKHCFGEWVNVEAYAKHFFQMSQQISDKIIKNYIYFVDDKPVGFGGLVISKNDNLAYLHNTGVLTEFRRQGYYSDLVNFRMDLAHKYGIDECFALVEDQGGSFRALSRLDFHEQSRFYLYG